MPVHSLDVNIRQHRYHSATAAARACYARGDTANYIAYVAINLLTSYYRPPSRVGLLDYPSSHKLSESSCAERTMLIWLGNSLCLLPPPYSRLADIAVSLPFFPYITITPVLPIPSWRRKLATEFLKYLAVMVRATPPTAPLITFLTMSFSYYHISDTTRINPRPNTWRHIVVVIHFFKLEITNTPLTALFQIWRRI